MKAIEFLGNSLNANRNFPVDAKQQIGYRLDKIQRGQAADWKPMSSVGAGVKEIRIRATDGNYRVIYVARFADHVYILNAFQKKQQKTPQAEINRAKRTLKVLVMSEKYTSVWDAISDTSEEAENMKLRSMFMMAIEKTVRDQDRTQVETAAILGLTQPRLNDLLKGKIDKFSLDMLVNIAAKAGLKTSVKIEAA